MIRWLEQQAVVRERRGLVRTPLARSAAVGPAAAAVPAVDLASNDYLGLATDPRLAEAAADAARLWGTGATSSRLVAGTTELHLELEHELARLTCMESALVYSSGYLANLGVITALGGPGTLLVADEHCHASLVDGFRLSRSRVETFPHNDVDRLSHLLTGRQEPRALIAVESVYSVLGDAAPLNSLLAVAEHHDAVLLIDEAHSLGVAGTGAHTGHGSVAGTPLAGHPNVVLTATLSKSLGAQGGAVMGSGLLREHLINRSRSFIFDTGLAPTSAAAALAALRIICDEPWRPTAVRANAVALTAALGLQPAAGAVQSVPLPSAEAALSASQAAHSAGVRVGCFRPPSVPDGVSRLRLTARATLTTAEIDHSCNVLRRILEDHL
ncbi:8-amino-7-oxononanoate synthase [Arthrobacter sp. ISL-30]|uniref:8-amino-7-oxononanoate synthase n=1 Tax=Arthrobacter sp. ISL-30 TaxID=2819109 RepID=UPI001BE71490|nr:8-amino-7-oxononanoate synthase [Arthrobacter sp. ISL-30]